MKIGLLDIDSHAKVKKWGATVYPNLALCKIAAYHKQRGDDVEWASQMEHYDILYRSKVFTFTRTITTFILPIRLFVVAQEMIYAVSYRKR